MAATVIDVAAPLLLLAIALAYARRVSTLAARGRPVEIWRQIAIAGGIVVLIVSDVPTSSSSPTWPSTC